MGGSGDHSVRVWRVDETLNAQSSILTCSHIGNAHNAAVCAVAISPNRDIFCSGSWDNSVCLWPLRNTQTADSTSSENASSSDRAVKRRKTANGEEASTTVCEPRAQLDGHK